MEKKDKTRQIKMHINPQEEGGVYSNVATVIHSETEFLVDFGMFVPGRDSIRIGARIVLSPRTAKQLLFALSQNIQNYESRMGEIKLPKIPTPFPSGTPEMAQ